MEFKARDRTPSKIIVIRLWFSTRCKWRFCKRLWIKLASHKVNKQLHKKAKQIRTVLVVDLAMMVLWLFKQLFVTRCPLLYFAMTLSWDTLSICAAAVLQLQVRPKSYFSNVGRGFFTNSRMNFFEKIVFIACSVPKKKDFFFVCTTKFKYLHIHLYLGKHSGTYSMK